MYQAPCRRLYRSMYARTVPALDLNQAVAEELETLRRVARLTQAELADASGISLRSVQRYLDGTRPIRIDDLAKLAGALGADPIDVFTTAKGRVQ
jgi:transcriptional regulator with XRE-family HTH domain